VVTERIKTAVVDATHEDEPGHERRRSPCRYLATVANRPLIAQVVHSLVEDGIEHVVVVSPATMCHRIESALELARGWGVQLTYLASDGEEPLISGLRRAVGDEPVLVHAGDCLFPGQLPRLRASFCARELDLAVLSASVESEQHGGQSVELLRLPRENPAGTAFVLGGKAWAELERDGAGGLDVRRLVERVQTAGGRVGSSEIQQSWCYEASTNCLLAGNRMLLDALPAGIAPAQSTEDCLIEGRVAQCPSARVSRSRVRGPVLIGAGAVVEDSFIGPYTAIGPGAVVLGAEIEYSMVLAGAEVRYPRYPLEASVIGERAVVAQSFGLPAGLHLELGPDARVILG
jgi:glucose-1-phosphate thymidylyltransferase